MLFKFKMKAFVLKLFKSGKTGKSDGSYIFFLTTFQVIVVIDREVLLVKTRRKTRDK